MSKVNPFLMLGLNETVLGSVSDEDIMALAQSQYRALSRIFHPDAGGSAAIFAMISEAYESIQDEVARKEYLDDFVSSRADQLVRTQRDLMDLEEKRLEDLAKVRAEHANFLADFVRAQNSEESLPLNSGDLVLMVQDSISDREMYVGDDPDEKIFTEGFSIISRSGGRVAITKLINTGSIEADPTITYGKGMIKVLKKTKGFPPVGTWCKTGMESTESMVARIDKLLSEANYTEEQLKEDDEVPRVLLFCFEEEDSELTDFVLLGSLPEDFVKFSVDASQRSDFMKMLEAPAGAESRQILGKELSYDDFQFYLGEIAPSFEEGNYLVAARLQGNILRFIVVGEILPHRSL